MSFVAPATPVADCRAMSAPADAGAAPPDAHDAHLMQAYAAGDAQAFDTLYQRHHAALYRFVRRLLSPALLAQADEVFQETWLRVVHSRERWQPQGASFRTWLFTIAHHAAIDRLRRSAREVALVDERDDESTAPFEPATTPWSGWPDPAGAGAPDSSDRLFWKRAGERLLQCLEQLPAAQKAVFLLHHDEGWTLEELAASLALGFETAKSRLRYAMTKLRTCMGAYLP